MTLELAKLKAGVGFILESQGKMFTGTGGEEPELVWWPSKELAEFSEADEKADWTQL